MGVFGDNDWRDFLAHAWAQDPQGKIREHAYNGKYYQEHRKELLEKAKARYAKLGKKRGGTKTAPEEEEKKSSKKGSGSKSSSSSSSKKSAEEAAKNTDLNVPDDAPEWLKNYINEIKKVRESTGNANWLPSHLNSFDDWKKELNDAYPDLDLSDSAAKEVFNEISKFKGSSSSSTSSSSKSTSNKENTSSTSSSSTDNKKSSTTSQNVAKEHRLEDFEEKAAQQSSSSSSAKQNVAKEHRLEDFEEQARAADSSNKWTKEGQAKQKTVDGKDYVDPDEIKKKLKNRSR